MPLRFPWRGRPRFFKVIVVLGLVLSFLYAAGLVLLVRWGGREKVPGWTAREEAGGYAIDTVDPAVAPDLRSGDRILSLMGEHRLGNVSFDYLVRCLPFETPYSLTVARDGQERSLQIRVITRPNYEVLFDSASVYLVSLAMCVAGLAIGLLKPDARAPCLAPLAMGLYFLEQSIRPALGFIRGADVLVYLAISAIQPLHFPLTYDFYLGFPPGVPSGRRWRLLRNVLYAWAAILVPRRITLAFLHYLGPRTFVEALAGHPWLWAVQLWLLQALIVCSVAATVVVIARNYRRVETADQKRRVRWVTYSSAMAIVPWLVWAPDLFVFPPAVVAVVQPLMNLALLLIPATLGYAILKHKIYDIHVVIRRGLQYLLARNFLRVLLSVPLALLGWAVLAKPHRTVVEILAEESLVIWAAAAAALSLRFRGPLSDALDRRFFREAVDQERLLLGLIEEVKRQDSMPQVSRLLSQRLEAALHPKAIHVLYRETERRDLTLGYSSSDEVRYLRIAQDSGFSRLLERQRAVLDYPFKDPALGLEPLDRLGVCLIVPLVSSDEHLIGLLLLGERKSEEPYSPHDKRLLKTLADQVAIVYEVLELRQEVGREKRLQQEVLARLQENAIAVMRQCPRCGRCYDGGEGPPRCEDDQAEIGLALPVERTLDGKYRLERYLGKGGMGAVYEATDLRLGRRVAVKVLLAAFFREDTALRRFEREARAAARLSHVNIVSVYDYGSLPGGGAYLVMELLRGRTFRADLVARGAVEPPRLADRLDEVLDAVGAAHGAGVIHRDLKPENVFLAEQAGGRDLVKVLDFGLAKLKLDDLADSTSLTVPGTVLGTLRYMSPEQLSSQDTDERTDIFSLGVMAAEALAGRHPFEARSPNEIATSILYRPFALAGEAREIRQVNAVLAACMAKNQADRYRTVAEVRRDLIPALRACPPLCPSNEPAHEAISTVAVR